MVLRRSYWMWGDRLRLLRGRRAVVVGWCGLGLSGLEAGADLLAGCLTPEDDGSHEQHKEDHAQEPYSDRGQEVFLSRGHSHGVNGPARLDCGRTPHEVRSNVRATGRDLW